MWLVIDCWWFWLEIGVNHVFLEISGWFVDELLLDFRLVWIGVWVCRSWCYGDGGSGIGYWWVCDDVIQSSRWLCFQWSLGRMRRGDRVVVLLRLLRLMMLDVELVVNLYRSSRVFSRDCCVFGIIVRFADWLIDFYLKWCGVWWCRLFWIAWGGDDQGSGCITSTRG